MHGDQEERERKEEAVVLQRREMGEGPSFNNKRRNDTLVLRRAGVTLLMEMTGGTHRKWLHSEAGLNSQETF